MFLQYLLIRTALVQPEYRDWWTLQLGFNVLEKCANTEIYPFRTALLKPLPCENLGTENVACRERVVLESDRSESPTAIRSY